MTRSDEYKDQLIKDFKNNVIEKFSNGILKPNIYVVLQQDWSKDSAETF